MAKDFGVSYFSYLLAELGRSSSDVGLLNGLKAAAEVPLMFAAGYNANEKVIELLLEKGADMEAKSSNGGTPLLFAVLNKEKEKVTELLLKSGASVSAGMLVCAAGDNANEKVTELLLKIGVDVNETDSDGKTPLMCAARYSGNEKIVSILLQQGANPRAKDKDGRNALYYAKNNNKLSPAARGRVRDLIWNAMMN